MEFKKRKAELQLTQENVDEVEAAYTEARAPPENSASNDESKGEESKTVEEMPAPSPAAGGFLAYAKSNPFASAMAGNAAKNAFAATPSIPTSFGAISATKSSFTMPPPLVLPSPKSPKANPFSSPSPAHNPFMTIVDNNDDLWKSMANDKLTADEAAKSSVFGDSKGKKSPVYKSAFFGGNSNQSSFSSVTSSALAAATSVFGSSSFGSSAAATGAADDEADGDDGEEGGEDNDGEASPGNAHASMKIISLPENVKLVTGEEEDFCLLQLRSKLYRLNANIPSAVVATTATTSTAASTTEKANGDADHASASAASSVLEAVSESAKSNGTAHKKDAKDSRVEWAEVGIGPLKILSRKTSSDSGNGASVGGSVGRLVMRREEKQGGIGTKLLLNVRLNQYLTVSKQGDKMVQLICVNHADIPQAGANTSNGSLKIETYLIKTKTAQEADDIFTIATDFVAQSKAAQTHEDAVPGSVNA